MAVWFFVAVLHRNTYPVFCLWSDCLPVHNCWWQSKTSGAIYKKLFWLEKNEWSLLVNQECMFVYIYPYDILKLICCCKKSLIASKQQFLISNLSVHWYSITCIWVLLTPLRCIPCGGKNWCGDSITRAVACQIPLLGSCTCTCTCMFCGVLWTKCTWHAKQGK